MILKTREDRNQSIAALEALIEHPAASRHDIVRLRQQIDAIIKGDMSEAKAAYVLDVQYGSSRNWAVIHDLRIAVDGLTAQIDHLLINRLLDIWVLESKRLRSGIKVLDNGECLTFSGRTPIAIESPIEQNRLHVRMLQRLLDSGTIALPTRLGFKLRPKLYSLVLVAEGRISRPTGSVPGIETLIRTDQLVPTVEAMHDKGNPLDVAKLVSPETLESLARQLADRHEPIEYDWQRRFAIGSTERSTGRAAMPSQPISPPTRPSDSERTTPEPMADETAPAEGAKASRPSTQHCGECHVAISQGVARYCRVNKDRFGGRLLCQPCQAKVAASVRRS